MPVRTSFLAAASEARDRYVAFFRATITGGFPSDTPFAVELLVKANGRVNPEPFSLARLDVVLGTAPDFQIRRLYDDLQPSEPVDFAGPHGIRIHQESLSWEAVRLSFSAPVFRLQALEQWLDRWLDPHESRQVDASGLAGVVHELAWGSSDLGCWTLDIDFGSAPVAALDELLCILAESGVRSLGVSRYDTGV